MSRNSWLDWTCVLPTLIAAGVAMSQARASTDVVVRSGQAATGLVPGVVHNRLFNVGIGTFIAPPTVSAASSEIFLTGEVAGPGVTLANQNTVWVFAAGGTGELVARAANPAPGTVPGVSFGSLSSPFIDEFGHVGFLATLSGAPVTSLDDTGLWTRVGGELQIVGREGSDAFGLGNGVVYADFREPLLTSIETPVRLSFASVLRGPGVDGTNNYAAGAAMLMPSGGATTQLDLRLGQDAPDALDGKFLSVKRVVGPGGNSAYACSLYGPLINSSNGHGIWVDQSGSLALAVRAGDPAPGMPTGAVFSSLYSALDLPVVNRSGTMAFFALAAGAGLDWTTNTGIWTNQSGSLEPAFIAGTQAPGYAEGVVFGPIQRDLSAMVISDSGAITLSAVLRGPGILGGQNNRALFRNDGNQIALIAASDHSVTGLPAGVTLSAVSLAPVLRSNGSGDLFFPALVVGEGVNATNDWAMLAYQESQLRVVCREGDTLDGWIIQTLRWDKLQVNAAGQAAFLVNAVSSSDPLGIIRVILIGVDSDGSSRVIAAETQSLDLSPGGLLVVGGMAMSDRAALADDGRVVFAVRTVGTAVDDAVLAVQIRSDVPMPCPADHDESGDMSVEDIFAFLTDWFAGGGDFDGNGLTEVPDIFAFLEAWFQGCPG